MKIKALKVKLKYGCFFVSLQANHSTNNRNIKEKMKRISMMAVALLNASVNYQLCKPVSLWLRGENLLAQRYEIIAGYPMPRATFMGGASIRF